MLLVALMVTMSLSGCFGEDEMVFDEPIVEVIEQRVFVTDKAGNRHDFSIQ